MTEQNELARARQLVEQESSEDGAGNQIVYEEGFSGKTVVGVLFIAFVMLPGAIYLGLVAGQGLGPAAEWVTIVLFSEIMRRSFLPMKKQEIYILYYAAASLTGLDSNAISGGPFGGLIWNQYFIQTPQAARIANQIPHWVVPPAGSVALLHRTFFDHAWLVPIGLMLLGSILGRINGISAGYFLFRITSDVEQLPFPMAPVAASGATALADAASKEESWRWRVFSIGSMIGLIFGFFYVAIPVFTGVVFGHAFQLLPIPFFDLTRNTESFLPGGITGITADLGAAMVGFVIPYHIVLGSFISSFLFRVFLAPVFVHLGLYGTSTSSGWTPGMDAIVTKQVTDIKFWLSVSIGLQMGVALIGLVSVVKALLTASRVKQNKGLQRVIPKNRGDIPMWVPPAIWLLITIFYIFLVEYLLHLDGSSHYINPGWLIFFGLIWTPINSYVSARMIGLTGSGVSIPFLSQIAIMKSGYPYVDIWYAPIPLNDFGGGAQSFRTLELVSTKFVSVVKVETLMFFVIMPASFIYWAFLWHTSQIPSAQFPYAAKFWPINSTFQAMFNTINSKNSGMEWVHQAINYPRIGLGLAVGLGLYGVFSLFKLPVLFYYGFIGGIGAFPQSALTTFLGAWMGKRYFSKRFGEENWRMMTPVLLAGFSCGTGLIAMVSIALALIAKSVNYLPF